MSSLTERLSALKGSSRKDNFGMADPPAELAHALAKDMKFRAVLDAMDEVRPFLKEMEGVGEMLTAIVVVGDQSSGKSSTLERIAGINLPRGQGICTRVPLEMQLRKGSDFSATLEYQQDRLGSRRTVQMIDKARISGAIDAATREIVGNSKNVEDLPIVLRICGPEYQDLTLIDLPGIARVPVQGQRSDIEEVTMTMMRRYITGEAKVILCSLPATADFVTSAALKLALELDPDGDRTLGVVTKVDQARKGIAKKLQGTDASEVTLRLGFVAVRCRTEDETDAGITLEQVRLAEESLFRTDDELRNVDESCKGVSALLQKLVIIQRERLIKHLPKILHQVDDQIKSEKEIYDQVRDVVENADDAFTKARDCVQRICTEFRERARCEKLDSDVSLRVSTVVSREFEKFQKQMGQIWGGVFSNDVWQKIQDLNKDVKGFHLPNFLASPVFDTVFEEYVLNSLHKPAQELVGRVLREVQNVLGTLIGNATRMYPNLSGIISAQVSDFLEKRAEITEGLVEECVNSQSECMASTMMYMDTLAELQQIKSGGGTAALTAAWGAQVGQGRFNWFRQRAASLQTSDDRVAMEILCALVAHAKTVGLLLSEQIPKFVRRNLVFMLYKDRGMENVLVEALGKLREALFEIMSDEMQVKKRDKSEQNLKKLKVARQKLRSAVGFGGALPLH